MYKRQDIKSVEASNGARYLFSDTYMVLGYAKGLCEWVEVGQFEKDVYKRQKYS